MYAKYTGFFRTRRENHNLIKFSPFWERYNLIKFSPFYREGDPKRYFCAFGEKEQTSKRQTNVLKLVCLVKSKSCDAYAPSHEPVKNPVRGPHKILCTCGAKWHQNSAVLGKISFNQILAVLYGKGTPKDTFVLACNKKNAPWKRCVFDWFNN